MLTDLAGDKQGVLSANAITDDNTPTFSGTGQPGATIQIKDSSGNTLASAMVSKDGTDGKTADPDRRGTYRSVVQIDGSKTTSAGSITVTVDTAVASVTLATTAGITSSTPASSPQALRFLVPARTRRREQS